MSKDNIFIIGFDKSGETINGDPSDFIAHYEKSAWKPQIFAIGFPISSDKI